MAAANKNVRKDDNFDGLRSRSVHSKVRNADKRNSGKKGDANSDGGRQPAAQRRPVSMHEVTAAKRQSLIDQQQQKREERIASKQQQASVNNKPKVSPAFGSNSSRPSNVGEANGPKGSKIVDSKRNRNNDHGNAPKPTIPRASKQDSGISGFQKLQLGVAGKGAKGGPMVVSYEDEEGYGGSGGQMTPIGRELKGVSEHLYLKNRDIDVIGEDQLDKLLNKASRAR